eukprot:CAMPEP_0181120296 /NCGR_PEP_ID=MMETSP1071-20121207/24079_1 /TAXON_ID=35127 /ORGANISM="Thalassiosira sp., Strain NH16" /LENGTH=197 /DNA_ID=CAMNT_0023204939 /DNA_START=75 /DNA_END=665 /DNA_ORIENTATION=+
MPENEDIRCVASPYASSSTEGITTPVLSAGMKHLILERLEKEIVCKLSSGSICYRRRRVPGKGQSGKKRRRESQSIAEAAKAMETAESVVRSRFIVGINQCTRMLESVFKHRNEGQQQNAGLPLLILLARDVRPASIIAHISIYARLLNIPILILPGKASVELGKAVGIRSVAAAAFLSSPGEYTTVATSVSVEQEW